MMTRIRTTVFVFLVVLLSLVACRQTQTLSAAIQPKTGQPKFPALGDYWVIDNGCHLSKETVKMADQVFEKLRLDNIAEVAVVCQTGVKDHGPTNDELIWTRDWGRWAKLGDKKDQRAIVWLIRPDVKPEENRVTIEVSTWLYWYTAVDYGLTLEEAANYANWDDFDGALETIVRGTDEVLRKLWEDKSHRKGGRRE